jgi:uncharacterized OB-fold protein
VTEPAPKPFRVQPRLDDLNRPFWTSGERGELVVPRCEACGYLQHPPQPRCAQCLSTDVTPAVLSGLGTVVSVTVNEQAWNPTMPAPYTVALVSLDEQPDVRLMTNIVGCDPYAVSIGMRVRAIFEQHDALWIPLFAPVESS